MNGVLVRRQTRHARWIWLLVLLTLPIVGRAAHAEPSPRPKVARASDHPGLESIDKVSLGRMRVLRAWRVITELELDEMSSTRVLPIFARYDGRDLALMVERRDVSCQLRTLVAAGRPDDTHITSALDRLASTKRRRRILHEERLHELRAMLSPQRQARLLLLLPRLKQAFAHWVREAIGEGTRFCDHASHDETIGRSTSERSAR